MKKAIKKQRPYLTLEEFEREMFTPAERKWIKERAKYYELLFTFRYARKKKGMTQVELAQEAEVNRTTLSKIESGERNATVDVLMRMANALGKSLELKLR